jgi:hypothetical protein
VHRICLGISKPRTSVRGKRKKATTNNIIQLGSSFDRSSHGRHYPHATCISLALPDQYQSVKLSGSMGIKFYLKAVFSTLFSAGPEIPVDLVTTLKLKDPGSFDPTDEKKLKETPFVENPAICAECHNFEADVSIKSNLFVVAQAGIPKFLFVTLYGAGAIQSKKLEYKYAIFDEPTLPIFLSCQVGQPDLTCSKSCCNSDQVCAANSCVNPSFPPNDLCKNAIGPLVPGVVVRGTTKGSTNDGAPACGDAKLQMFGGVWYHVIGDGSIVMASTCHGDPSIPQEGLTTQLKVFTGTGCGQQNFSLKCLVGNDNDPRSACSVSSGAVWKTEKGTMYYILVDGLDASGDFGIVLTKTSSSPTTSPSSSPTPSPSTGSTSEAPTPRPKTSSSPNPSPSTGSPDEAPTPRPGIAGPTDPSPALTTNDSCEQATTLLTFSDPTQGITGVSNSASPNELCGAAGGVPTTDQGAWYSYVGEGTFTTVTICSSGTTPVLPPSVYSGSSCDALVCVTERERYAGLEEAGTFATSYDCPSGTTRSAVSCDAGSAVLYHIWVHDSGVGTSRFDVIVRRTRRLSGSGGSFPTGTP